MNYITNDNAAIGQRMRQIRKEARMTQEKLALVLKVSTNYLGEVERGHKPLSRSLAKKFCQQFQVSLDYLYHGIPPIRPLPSIRERSTYDILQISLSEQLKYCSHHELMVIQQLINGYLSASRHMDTQPIPKNYSHRQKYTYPQAHTPDPISTD